MTRSSFIPLVTLLAVILAGLVSSLFSPALFSSPDAEISDGSWASEYQENFSAGLPWFEPARSAWNALDLRVFGQTPAGVVAGSDGWLFTSEEYRTGDAAAMPMWLDRISAVRSDLNSRGAELLVALVPAKADMLQQLAPPLPGVPAGLYQAALSGLQELGIPAVDLRTVLGQESDWLQTDTHWTPAGISRVAGLLAEAAANLVPGLPGEAVFEVETLAAVEFTGDLERLLALGSFGSNRPAEVLVPVSIRPTESSGGLFDSVELPAALVGTSYSAGEYWPLAELLELELGIDILDASESGLGPLAPMRDYLTGEAFLNNPPELVIWEIPVRYLNDTAYVEEENP